MSQAWLRDLDEDARGLGHPAREDARPGYHPIAPALMVSCDREQRGPKRGQCFGDWISGQPVASFRSNTCVSPQQHPGLSAPGTISIVSRSNWWPPDILTWSAATAQRPAKQARCSGLFGGLTSFVRHPVIRRRER